jgi:hypothetical protein
MYQQKNDRASLEKRIERYKAIARQIPDEVTIQSIETLIAELEQTLSRIDDSKTASVGGLLS